jgi:hypothetical protein
MVKTVLSAVEKRLRRFAVEDKGVVQAEKQRPGATNITCLIKRKQATGR